MKNWFPGPEGDLYFDKCLFASSKENGITIWDIDSGKCLYHDRKLSFLSYHPIDRSFISRLPNKDFQISRLCNK